jgi:hypothetical protein
MNKIKIKKIFLISNFFSSFNNNFLVLDESIIKAVTLNKIKFFSKFNLTFKSQLKGFFFIEFFNFFNSNFNSFFFSFLKKNIFSFLSKNELHRHILKKYLKNFSFANNILNEKENKQHYLINFFNNYPSFNHLKKQNLTTYFITKNALNEN